MKNLPNKVTPGVIEHILAQSKVDYVVLGGKLTHCTITLPSGFLVTGESSCVDPSEYNKTLGEEYAKARAVQALYMLEGYMLASDLYEQRERVNLVVDMTFRHAELAKIVDTVQAQVELGKPEDVTDECWDATQAHLHHLNQAMVYLFPPLTEDCHNKEKKMFELMKQIPTAAHRWFKTGDHPEDNSGFIGTSVSVDHLSEGNVVRRYIHPQVSGDNICPQCGHRVKRHGWIDQEDFSATVCPGDWIITVIGGYRVISNDTFITLFEEPMPVDLQGVSYSDAPTIQEVVDMEKNENFSLHKIVSEFDVSYTEIAPNILACALSHKGARFTVTGMASCLDPDLYDEKAAKEHAYNDAAGKVHQFEQYRQGMNQYFLRDIGYAVAQIKMGLVAARKGWIGSDEFIFYVPAARYPASRNGKGTLLGQFPDDMVPYNAYLAIKNADGTVTPWVPSLSDTLGEDWYAWSLTTTN